MFSLHDYQHFELSLLFEYVEIYAFHFWLEAPIAYRCRFYFLWDYAIALKNFAL
jgi:hypothetical protein